MTLYNRLRTSTLISGLVLIVSLTVLTALLGFIDRASTQTETPHISVEQQQGAPILISSTYVDSSNPLKPKFGYVMTNVSDKTIRAYAIRHEINYGIEQAKQSSAVLSHLISESLLLQPNQSSSINEGGDFRYPQSVNEIKLSVDFVEFTDGITWGNDSFKSSERLAGQRAGGKAAIKKFREKLNSGGLDVLTNAITQSDIVLPDTSNVSHEWREGFQTGVGIVRNRLKEAKNKGSLAAVKQELEKPFDATEGRQQR